MSTVACTSAWFTNILYVVSSSFVASILFTFTVSKLVFPDFKILSMGMSNDYKIAVEEGANMVRIGTGIFGERQY